MKDDIPIVVSLGGSLIVPDEIDTDFLSTFREYIEKQVSSGRRFIIVTGGGKTTRKYQKAAREVNSDLTSEDLDWIGLYPNQLNGHLLRYILKDISGPTFLGDPTKISLSKYPVLVAGGGWKPGSTSDLYTVEVAGSVGAKEIVNLSNITNVYDSDPKENPNAKKLTKLSWNEYRTIIPAETSPGIHAPFDPIASRRAHELGLTVVIMGNDLSNLEKYFDGEDFEGTTIS